MSESAENCIMVMQHVTMKNHLKLFVVLCPYYDNFDKIRHSLFQIAIDHKSYDVAEYLLQFSIDVKSDNNYAIKRVASSDKTKSLS